MKIGLFGHGKMGEVVELEAKRLHYPIVEPSGADVCIDFSHSDVAIDHVEWAITHQIPLIIGTTGWESQLPHAQKRVEETESTAILASPNFSLGVALFIQLAKHAKALFAEYDLAGIECHHKEKTDAPSGTALKIAHQLDMKNPFSSVRCGTITGKHMLLFDSPSDSITLTHEAHSRAGFARGALKAAAWILGKKGWFTLEEMLGDLYSSHYPFQRERGN